MVDVRTYDGHRSGENSDSDRPVLALTHDIRKPPANPSVVSAHRPSFAQLALDASRVTLPSPAAGKEFATLERLNPEEHGPTSRFAPGILVKFA